MNVVTTKPNALQRFTRIVGVAFLASLAGAVAVGIAHDPSSEATKWIVGITLVVFFPLFYVATSILLGQGPRVRTQILGGLTASFAAMAVLFVVVGSIAWAFIAVSGVLGVAFLIGYLIPAFR